MNRIDEIFQDSAVKDDYLDRMSPVLLAHASENQTLREYLDRKLERHTSVEVACAGFMDP